MLALRVGLCDPTVLGALCSTQPAACLGQQQALGLSLNCNKGWDIRDRDLLGLTANHSPCS